MSRSSRLVAAIVAVLCLGGLGVQALHGNAVVSQQRSARTVADALLDDAYYDCLDTQAHSLISPHTPVRYRPGVTLGESIVLNKTVGSWIDVAVPGTSPVAFLGIRHTGGPGSCLGDVVVAKFRTPDGRWITRFGHGAAVPGNGPPPAPPL